MGCKCQYTPTQQQLTGFFPEIIFLCKSTYQWVTVLTRYIQPKAATSLNPQPRVTRLKEHKFLPSRPQQILSSGSLEGFPYRSRAIPSRGGFTTGVGGCHPENQSEELEPNLYHPQRLSCTNTSPRLNQELATGLDLAKVNRHPGPCGGSKLLQAVPQLKRVGWRPKVLSGSTRQGYWRWQTESFKRPTCCCSCVA